MAFFIRRTAVPLQTPTILVRDQTTLVHFLHHNKSKNPRPARSEDFEGTIVKKKSDDAILAAAQKLAKTKGE